jgi:hypothetical protein
MSSGVSSCFAAKEASAINSVAWAPTIWTPKYPSVLPFSDRLEHACSLSQNSGHAAGSKKEAGCLYVAPLS